MGLNFFAVGSGRSGTTMFRRLLTVHPDIFMPRETHWIPIMYDYFGLREAESEELIRIMEETYMAKGRTALLRITDKCPIPHDEFMAGFRRRLPASGKCAIRVFMDAFYGYLCELHGAKTAGDKTPDYAQCMTVLQSIWPEAKFLHIYRDGRDVALSMREVLSFRLQVAWRTNHWWAVAYSKIYEREMEKAKADIPLAKFYELWRSRYLRTMDEKRRLNEGSYMDFRYEELLIDPPGVLGNVADFLGLPDRDRWIAEAAKMVIPGNMNKNKSNPEYIKLTEKYADDLKSLGFEP